MIFEEAPGEESEENVKGHQRKGSPCSVEAESLALLLPVITWNEEYVSSEPGHLAEISRQIKGAP